MFTPSIDTRPDARYAQRYLHALAAALCCLLLAPVAWSAPLAISDSPLFLASGVRPNVFLELDDSGSMDWEILTKKHWLYCEYDRNAPLKPYDSTKSTAENTCDALRDDGLWQAHHTVNDAGEIKPVNFEYIYNNSDAAYADVVPIACDSNDRQALYACNATLASNTPYQNDWRILSSDFNVLYYDPQESYLPWLGPCLDNDSDPACKDADFTSARSNPREGTAGFTVTRNLDKFTWETWVDDNGYDAADGRPLRGDDINFVANTTNGIIDLWDSHSRFEIDSNNINVTTTTYAPDSTGLHPTTSTSTLSGSDCHPELASNTETCRSIAQVKQNVANWYQYARKRQFVAKGGISAVINNVPNFRYGLDTINQSSGFVEVPAGLGNFKPHNDSLLESLYSFAWPTSGTPLRQGLQRAGDYFDNDGANNLGLTNPIAYSCQKNFSVLLTDGYWNGDSPDVGNVDGDADADGEPIADTVADVARLYYNHDLDVDMANDVQPDKYDSATYQHLVTYTLAFGVEGKLVADTTIFDPPEFGKGPGWPTGGLTASSNWGDPNSCSNCAEKIDDLWHAAYNSRGTFISASTPGNVVAGLKAALINAESRSGSASSVALNSGALRTDTKLYQARFYDTDWHGELLSVPILDTDGNEGVPDTDNAVDAGVKIQAAADRIMMTHNGSEGVLFAWSVLSTAQQAALNTDAAGTPADGLGDERLEWLRGDQTNDGGIFRNRKNSLLGDIVNSSPTYVGPPQARYPILWSGASAPENLDSAQTYLTFKQTYQNRTPIVYVGTNGGTLNGFDADFTANPIEKLAYVPGTVFENLSQLMDPGYSHRFYVDGSPTVIDAFFSSDKQWHTVLAGSLNRGGQGIYALDITNPAGFAATATSAENVVLWEFNDVDSDPDDAVIDGDADLGFTFSRPAIVRLHNGKWAAVFGNGYNNTHSDGNPSATGHAVLFIVDIETGALIKKIDTGTGSTGSPNGLATPAVVDINGDFIADVVYAGDLEGNLWKFDITDASPANWDVAFHDGASKPEPLYVAEDGDGNRQPITVRPDVGRRPDAQQSMLYFGTGMYLQTADLSNTDKQTFYGIIDDGTSFTGRANLAEQTVIFQGTFSGTDPEGNTISTPVRATSNEPADTRGWFMDLPDPGERNVSNPILRAGRIIFVTVVPDADVCKSGGSSWLMELDALSGSRLDESPFDLNNDRSFNLTDYINVGFDVDGDGDVDEDDRLPVSGKGFESLIPTPGILSDGEKEYKYTPDSSGGLERTIENPGKSAVGRQSWGQLR